MSRKNNEQALAAIARETGRTPESLAALGTSSPSASGQAAKDARTSKKRMMNIARKQSANPIVRLDAESLEIKKIAARETGLQLYTQKTAGGERRHFLAAPHGVPRLQTKPFAEDAADPEWWQLPERDMRRLDDDGREDVALGVRIGETVDGRVTVKVV